MWKPPRKSCRFQPKKARLETDGESAESAIRAFFGGNALVAIIVLTLITIFLFREGSGFFGQNLTNLRLYRQAGLEYVDIIRGQAEKQTALSRQLGDIRLQQMRAGADKGALEKFDEFANKFSDTGEQLNGLLSDATDQAQALRDTMLQLGSYAGVGVIDKESQDERSAAAAPAGNEAEQMAVLRSATDKFQQIADSMKPQISDLLAASPALTNAKSRKAFAKWKAEVEEYVKQLTAVARADGDADDFHAGGGRAATTCRAPSRKPRSRSARRGSRRSCASSCRRRSPASSPPCCSGSVA